LLKYDGKRLNWKSLFPIQKLGVLGLLLYRRCHDDETPKKAYPCLKPCRLSHYASFYDVPFGLCMRPRNDELKKMKKAREGNISRICQGATVQPIEFVSIGLIISDLQGIEFRGLP
jgi:hypothetical protein